MTDTTEDNRSAPIGEGNITSTPTDLARWIRQLLCGQAGLNANTITAMKTRSFSPSPYGWGLSSITGLGYGHNGADQGYLSLMRYDPDSDVAVVVYFNVWDMANLKTHQNDLLTQAALDARKAVGY